MHQVVRRAGTALAGVLLLATAACSGDDRTAPPPAATAAQAPAVSFDSRGGQCTPYPARFLLYERMRANTTLTLTGAELVRPEHGARILGSWTSDVTSEKVPTGGWTLGDEPDMLVRDRIGWATKRPLPGSQIRGTTSDDAGQELEFLLRLDMPDGSSFDGVDVGWKTDDGRSGTAHWDVPTSVGPSCQPRRADRVIDAGGIRPGLCVGTDEDGIRLARSFRAVRDVTLTYDTLGTTRGLVRRSWVVPVPATEVVATTLLDRGAPLPRSDWKHRQRVADAHLEAGRTYAWVGDLVGDAPASGHGLSLAWVSAGGRSGIASVPLDLAIVEHRATDC
ncbi:hypothetical protein [Nocardioides jiangxiensis]|uniref:Secreted protein n=1 Tax=Nocardioides jiangxiensis TaxID=3064524 RepID=A0ABT9AZW8_9ACTN|nr:hypothetical protein [Nocardioides sp. WY-20]MDO7867523.1 hypothetical protein [Nocardioides sp. WY-20]